MLQVSVIMSLAVLSRASLIECKSCISFFYKTHSFASSDANRRVWTGTNITIIITGGIKPRREFQLFFSLLKKWCWLVFCIHCLMSLDLSSSSLSYKIMAIQTRGNLLVTGADSLKHPARYHVRGTLQSWRRLIETMLLWDPNMKPLILRNTKAASPTSPGRN